MLTNEDIAILEQSFPAWEKLNPTQQATILQNTSLLKLDKGELLQQDNEDCSGILIIKEGSLRVFTISEEGKDITFYRLHPGDVSILSASCVIPDLNFDIYNEAINNCHIIKIKPCAFAKIMEENLNLKAATYKLSTKRLCSVTWAMQRMLFTSFDKRLAHFLVEEQKQQGSMVLAITHEQIAKFIGTAREVVTRMLNHFADQNFVELTRGKVHIKDLSALIDIINK